MGRKSKDIALLESLDPKDLDPIGIRILEDRDKPPKFTRAEYRFVRYRVTIKESRLA